MLTRLRIGHTNYTHKYLMASGAERQAPHCSTCHVDLTIQHILVQCPNIELKRSLSFLSGKSLMEILGEDAPVEQILKFLKEINIYEL